MQNRCARSQIHKLQCNRNCSNDFPTAPNVSQFVHQLESVVTLNHFFVGMIKAPVFAYIVALVGCHQGLQVSGSAESVGRMTTKSVVTSIFLIIVANAIFSTVFSILKI